MSLREAVVITMPDGKRRGTLMVGHYGLPEVEAHPYGFDQSADYYTPGSFPTAWTLSSPACGELYTAWQEIEAVIERLREAEREAQREAEREGEEVTDLKLKREYFITRFAQAFEGATTLQERT